MARILVVNTVLLVYAALSLVHPIKLPPLDVSEYRDVCPKNSAFSTNGKYYTCIWMEKYCKDHPSLDCFRLVPEYMEEQGYNVYDYFTTEDLATNMSQEPISTTEKPDTPHPCVSMVSGFTREHLVLSAFAGAVILGFILWVISKVRDKLKSRTRAGSYSSMSGAESTGDTSMIKEEKPKETCVCLCNPAAKTGGDKNQPVVKLCDPSNNSLPPHSTMELSNMKHKSPSVHPVHYIKQVTANPSGGQPSGVMQNSEFQPTDTETGALTEHDSDPRSVLDANIRPRAAVQNDDQYPFLNGGATIQPSKPVEHRHRHSFCSSKPRTSLNTKDTPDLTPM